MKDEFKDFIVGEHYYFVQGESISVCYSFNAWKVWIKFISEPGSNSLTPLP